MPASSSCGATGPAAAKTMGWWPARFNPSALSNATFAWPPVMEA